MARKGKRNPDDPLKSFSERFKETLDREGLVDRMVPMMINQCIAIINATDTPFACLSMALPYNYALYKEDTADMYSICVIRVPGGITGNQLVSVLNIRGGELSRGAWGFGNSSSQSFGMSVRDATSVIHTSEDFGEKQEYVVIQGRSGARAINYALFQNMFAVDREQERVSELIQEENRGEYPGYNTLRFSQKNWEDVENAVAINAVNVLRRHQDDSYLRQVLGEPFNSDNQDPIPGTRADRNRAHRGANVPRNGGGGSPSNVMDALLQRARR